MPSYRFRVAHQRPDLDHYAVVDLPDDKAAWEQATTACGEILVELDGDLPEGSEWSMEVSDAEGAIFLLTFGARRVRQS